MPTNKRYVLVGGNYRAGLSVVDFTDPANAREVAYADPAPLTPTQLVIIWKLSDKVTAGAQKFDLNPQTAETSFELKG